MAVTMCKNLNGIALRADDLRKIAWRFNSRLACYPHREDTPVRRACGWRMVVLII